MRGVSKDFCFERTSDVNKTERELYLKNMLSGKTAAVLGIGVSNLPLIDFLLERGTKVVARDMKKREALGSELASSLEEKGVTLICGENYLDNITEDIVFRSPAYATTSPLLLRLPLTVRLSRPKCSFSLKLRPRTR